MSSAKLDEALALARALRMRQASDATLHARLSAGVNDIRRKEARGIGVRAERFPLSLDVAEARSILAARNKGR